jgi:hypothetical protein
MPEKKQEEPPKRTSPDDKFPPGFSADYYQDNSLLELWNFSRVSTPIPGSKPRCFCPRYQSRGVLGNINIDHHTLVDLYY